MAHLANRGLYTAKWRRGLELPPELQEPPVAPPGALTRLAVWRMAEGMKDRQALTRAYARREERPDVWRAIVIKLMGGQGDPSP